MKGYYPGCEDDDPLNNHERKLLRLRAEGKMPTSGIWHADIRHDDWCALLRGGRCNCDPDIQFVDAATWRNERGE